MTKRPLTQPELDFATSLCAGCGISVRREFVLGFAFGSFLAGVFTGVSLFCVVSILWRFSTPIAVALILGITILGGVAGGYSAANTARGNISSRHRQIVAIRDDISYGVVGEYSGNVAEAFLNTADNPEHPDIFIRFSNGDQVTLTLWDQTQHNVFKPPKRFATIAILPQSGLVVSVKLA